MMTFLPTVKVKECTIMMRVEEEKVPTLLAFSSRL